MSGGDYEAWVLALRQWGRDPSTDLSHLPSLRADSFTPATYQRLFRHLQDALATMMEGWTTRLQKVASSTADDHELARGLVLLRRDLARRLQLARHPGLPAEVTAELWKGAVDDVTAIQAQLEKNVTATTSVATSDRGAGDAILALLRQNSFTALLDPTFDIELMLSADAAPDPDDPAGVAPSEPVFTALPPSDAVRVPRRVLTDL